MKMGYFELFCKEAAMWKRVFLALLGCSVGGVIISKIQFLFEDKIYSARWRMEVAMLYYELLQENIRQGVINEYDEYWAERIAEAEKAVETATARYKKVLAAQSPQ